jgi:putative endonuclease
MKAGYVYLMASRYRGQTYLGSTSNLPQRAFQHRNALVEGHSKDKNCHLLVWFERFDDLQDARACEFRMKKWHRAWKVKLIEQRNPDWQDLFETLNH